VSYSSFHLIRNAETLSRNKYNPTGAEPVPESSLMYFAAQNGTYLPGFNDDAKLNLIPGRTYRLRVVNMAALAMFHFYIE